MFIRHFTFNENCGCGTKVIRTFYDTKMSVRDSFTPSNGFNGNVGFEANFDDLNRALDSPYSPGILETEMISNRSSVISDILNLNDKSYDLNTNTDSIKHFINKNDGLNSNNNQNFRSYQDNLSDNQNEDYLKKNTKSGVSSTLEAAALVDVDGSSLDDDADWSGFYITYYLF